MRNIDRRQRIGAQNDKLVASGEAAQGLPGAKHRVGAFQTAKIEFRHAMVIDSSDGSRQGNSADHHARVTAQFGPCAAAYVGSADHARGADLVHFGQAAAKVGARTALDLGCGGGHASFALAEAGVPSVIAYDLSEEMLGAVRAEAGRRHLAAIRTARGAAEVLPFASEAFDLVVTRFSAHHWADLRAALREMRRVARPGGAILVMDSVAPDAPALDRFLQEIETLRDPTHVRDYTEREWRGALEGIGLRPSILGRWRMRLGFDTWVERSGTPSDRVCAIRTLQTELDPVTQAAFGIEPDGSFLLDTMLIAAEIER